MIKYLFIIINSLGLFIIGLFNGDGGITLSHNIPANMVAGQEVTIELKLNKGGMNGFGKLQLELPEGITIKESEDKGANYSYNEGIAKWLWAALPTESEIVVKLTLLASETSTGAKTISAKYSYVENNTKQVVEMTPAEVNIVPPGTDLSTLAGNTPTTSPLVDSTSASVTNTMAAGNEPNGIISIVRTISAGSIDNEFLISLKIKKGNTKGFARFSDAIPDYIIVKGAKTEGGSFSVSDGKLKFVWVNVPEKDELEIAYTISGNTSSPVLLGGEYSYLEDNQSKKYKVPMETIAFQTSQIAKQGDKPSVKEEPIKSPEQPVANDPETTTPATVKSVEESVAKKLSETMNELPGVKKEGSLHFLVQVGAFTNGKVTAQRLKKKFKITQKINTEMNQGYSKFMIGTHTEYKTARDQRETMKNVNGVKSAFVVAYNQGKRITVQEALMVTNQRWFK